MAHTITIEDTGGDGPNHYKLVTTGGTKTEKATVHGATTDSDDTIYRTGNGNWAAQGKVYGGRDAYRYTGARQRLVLEHPDRVRLRIDDGPWKPADAFAEIVQRDDWPGESSSSSESGGDSILDALAGVADSIGDLLGLDDYGEVGPHAPARNTDRSDWNTVEVEDGTDLGALVERHGPRTVFELWGDVHLRDHETVETLVHGIAFVGKGTSQSTIHLHGNIDTLFQFGNANTRVSDIHVRNLDVDVTDAVIETGIVQAFLANRGAYIKDLVLRGELRGPGDGIVCQTGHSPAVVGIERFVAREGADRTERVDSTEDSVGIIMTGPSDGTLRLHDNELGGFPNNGVYCSGQVKHNYDGRAVVTDHTGYDSDRDQLRVGNDSLILGGTLFADEQKPNFDNLRGVWARFARGVVVADTSIKTHHSDHGEGIRVDSTSGEVTVRDCDIECRSHHRAARAITAYEPVGELDKTALTVERTRIHGDGTPRDAILIEKGRPDSTVDAEFDLPDDVEEVDHR